MNAALGRVPKSREQRLGPPEPPFHSQGRVINHTSVWRGVCPGLRLSRLRGATSRRNRGAGPSVRGRLWGQAEREDAADDVTVRRKNLPLYAPGARAQNRYTRLESVGASCHGHGKVQFLAARPYQPNPRQLLLDAIVEAENHLSGRGTHRAVGARGRFDQQRVGQPRSAENQDLREGEERPEGPGDQRQSSRTRCCSSS
jgi:hypothetical protein